MVSSEWMESSATCKTLVWLGCLCIWPNVEEAASSQYEQWALQLDSAKRQTKCSMVRTSLESRGWCSNPDSGYLASVSLSLLIQDKPDRPSCPRDFREAVIRKHPQRSVETLTHGGHLFYPTHLCFPPSTSLPCANFLLLTDQGFLKAPAQASPCSWKTSLSIPFFNLSAYSDHS